MDPHYVEWLNLLVRWIHVITGVAWIGASFYFNWLEGSLNRNVAPGSALAGDLWAVHGGGFYHVVKYEVAPATLPPTLHWFKWEAYTTWISGFCLLCIVYYLGAGMYLIDPTVAALTPWQAIAIGLSCLVGSWFAYDALCRSRIGNQPVLFASLLFSLIVALAYGLCQVFSSRGAYMHVGAVLGTLMAANVWRVIIPAQKALVAAMTAGEQPEAAFGKRALQRSLHNNYLTLPVLFIMISNHFPVTYAHPYNWVVLAALSLIGAGTRHYFNLKNRGHRKVWILPVACLAMFALALATKPPARSASSGSATAETSRPPSFAQVAAIIQARCSTCHSAQPTDDTFTTAPNGLMLDSPAQIHAKAALIKMRVVDAQTMPLANKTAMTADERQLIANWFAAGASIE